MKLVCMDPFGSPAIVRLSRSGRQRYFFNKGNAVVQQKILRSHGIDNPAAVRSGHLHHAAVHNDQHGLRLLGGNQIVKHEVLFTLGLPGGFVFTVAVL